MPFPYEAVLQYLREWHNPHNEVGQYDGNGLVQLMLAILDNLRVHESQTDLPEIRDAMTEEQMAFFLKIAGYVRGAEQNSDQPSAIATRWPTLGRTLEYLSGFGFTRRRGQGGTLVGEHIEEGSRFVFRERDLNTPARLTELIDLKTQLTLRGFVTEREFARFWHPCLERPESLSPNTTQ